MTTIFRIRYFSTVRNSRAELYDDDCRRGVLTTRYQPIIDTQSQNVRRSTAGPRISPEIVRMRGTRRVLIRETV